MAHSEMAS